MLLRRSLCVSVVIAALLGVAATSAQAAARVTVGSRYLALGDSVTFGYQEPNVTPRPNYADESSFPNYPRLLGSELRLRVANAACPGETSASFLDPRAPNLGCTNVNGRGGGYRSAFPLHVRYAGSQHRYAVKYLRRHRRTRLVSLLIGANDAFLCQQTTPDHCTSESSQAALFAKVRRNVRRIVRAIRRTARYRGQLVVIHYYSPFGYSSAFVTGVVKGLNHAIDQGASGYRARHADGYGEFARASAHSGGSTCSAGLLTQLSSGGCGVHPSYSGQVLLAHAVGRAIKH